MNLLVYFTFYCWNNPQGGDGHFVETKLFMKIEKLKEDIDIWNEIHLRVKKYLNQHRPYDQTNYSKKEGEYFIQRVELL